MAKPTGFGHEKFGHFPWGRSNFGESVTLRTFPEEYQIDEDGRPNEAVIHYLETIKDSANRVKSSIDDIPDQIDVDRVRQDLLGYLGTTIDVVLDDVEPLEFQRSLVGSAVQFYRIKGTANSYRIRGKISGFDVEVKNMYRIIPAYVPLFDPQNVFDIPAGSSNFYTDLPPGSVSGTPTEISCDYCLTAFIKLEFTVVKPQPPTVIGSANFFDRLVFKLRDIIPIHVRDVLYEIRLFILADEHQFLGSGVHAEENTYVPASFWYHFDVVPADVIPADTNGYIKGSTSLVDFP